jgi:hypothetical protein
MDAQGDNSLDDLLLICGRMALACLPENRDVGCGFVERG